MHSPGPDKPTNAIVRHVTVAWAPELSDRLQKSQNFDMGVVWPQGLRVKTHR